MAVAEEIRKLIRKERYRYREIGVIVSDMNVYGDYLEQAFETYGIPVFMDHKRSILCDKAAGVDVDKIQKTYLVYAGLKMVGMALLMGAVTVLVGFFASKVAAGIGMTLRENVFKKVVGFSNAEMDRFSTASLITRPCAVWRPTFQPE